ncbi:MFS transporter [Bacterioplanes sanyensis]|uniref:MFS transporter n=1 Tax=Bacterioplanes sanyensis TaxID=1249553 RepID=UPI001674AF6C|nr:MFS transporter [Bacterioplanes sanyensis]GGY56559.1 MFS transporter [Bacterioplanes sanyensis]
MKKDFSDSIYDKLVNEEDARACRAISDDACQQVPGNFLRIITAQFFSKLGDAVLNPKITLPWLLQTLGAPAFLLAWLVPLRESGSLLPQLAIASWVRTLPQRKWVWVLGATIQALSVLAMGLVALMFEGALAGWLVIALLALFSLARGLNSVAHKDVLGKTIPKNQRGQVNGWSASAAGLITILLAILLWFFGADVWSSNSQLLAWALLAAAALWLMAAGVFATVAEFSGEIEGGRNGLREALGQLAILRDDAPFRRFVMTRALFLCSALSAPYYVVLAHQYLGGDIAVLALFLLASGLASLLSAPLWGRFSDRSSLRVMQVAAAMAAACGAVLVVIAWWQPQWLQRLGVLPVLYFALSISHQGVRVGRKTYLVDMAEGNQRTQYVAVSNTLIGAVLLLFSAVGGLSQWLSVAGIIFVFSTMAVAGLLLSLRLPDVSQ